MLALDLLLNPSKEEVEGGLTVYFALGHLFPPMVNGSVDVGGYYGVLGTLMGHEMSHVIDDSLNAWLPPEKLDAFVQEQSHGQLQPAPLAHSFNDQFGVLIAHDAFERAMQGQPRPRIDGLSPEQRFFIGVTAWRGGKMWTGTSYTDPGWWDISGPVRFRFLTNGTLSTLPAFAKAFSCKAGGPMTGAHVWYKDPWNKTRAP